MTCWLKPGGGKWWSQALPKRERPQNSSLATGRGSHIPAQARIRDKHFRGWGWSHLDSQPGDMLVSF